MYKEDNKLTQHRITEHVRRYLLEAYGEDKVYNDGLDVVTACDLSATSRSEGVYEQVAKASQSQGWKGATKTLKESGSKPFALNKKPVHCCLS